MSHRRFKKRRLALLLIIVVMFFAAYAHHRYGSKPQLTGHFVDRQLDEVSGIAASAVNPGVYYVHNDSGDTSRFFAVDEAGNLKQTYYFKGEATNPLGVQDCEDIAVGPGPAIGKSYIYVGDIGDNRAQRPYLTVYRIAEPKVDAAVPVTNVAAASVHLRYPDGARDAETLMVDPVEQLIYIVSKREKDVNVYTAPLDFKNGDTVVLNKRSSLHFDGFPPFRWITAGDISADGSQILLKSYSKVFYWKRFAGQPVWQAMQNKPRELEYEQEKQGEAIGFERDGKSYLTTSEGVFAPVYRYTLPNQ